MQVVSHRSRSRRCKAQPLQVLLVLLVLQVQRHQVLLAPAPFLRPCSPIALAAHILPPSMQQAWARRGSVLGWEAWVPL